MTLMITMSNAFVNNVSTIFLLRYYMEYKIMISALFCDPVPP